MRLYYVEITHKRGGACVLANHAYAKTKRTATRLAFEAAGISKEHREDYDVFVEVAGQIKQKGGSFCEL